MLGNDIASRLASGKSMSKEDRRALLRAKLDEVSRHNPALAEMVRKRLERPNPVQPAAGPSSSSPSLEAKLRSLQEDVTNLQRAYSNLHDRLDFLEKGLGVVTEGK